MFGLNLVFRVTLMRYSIIARIRRAGKSAGFRNTMILLTIVDRPCPLSGQILLFSEQLISRAFFLDNQPSQSFFNKISLFQIVIQQHQRNSTH